MSHYKKTVMQLQEKASELLKVDQSNYRIYKLISEIIGLLPPQPCESDSESDTENNSAINLFIKQIKGVVDDLRASYPDAQSIYQERLKTKQELEIQEFNLNNYRAVEVLNIISPLISTPLQRVVDDLRASYPAAQSLYLARLKTKQELEMQEFNLNNFRASELLNIISSILDKQLQA